MPSTSLLSLVVLSVLVSDATADEQPAAPAGRCLSISRFAVDPISGDLIVAGRAAGLPDGTILTACVRLEGRAGPAGRFVVEGEAFRAVLASGRRRLHPGRHVVEVVLDPGGQRPGWRGTPTGDRAAGVLDHRLDEGEAARIATGARIESEVELLGRSIEATIERARETRQRLASISDPASASKAERQDLLARWARWHDELETLLPARRAALGAELEEMLVHPEGARLELVLEGYERLFHLRNAITLEFLEALGELEEFLENDGWLDAPYPADELIPEIEGLLRQLNGQRRQEERVAIGG